MRTPKHAQAKTVVAVIIFFLAAGIVAYNLQSLKSHQQATQGDPTPISTETVVYSTHTPEESPPDCESYRVADNEPRKLEIPRIGTAGCIQKVGTDQNNAIAAPTNVHLGGWYIDSVPPGNKGISLIDGHVSGRYGKAIFADLKSLRAGDIVRVQLGDGRWKTFETVDARNYPVETVMEHISDPLANTDSQLTLITCGGIYDKRTSSYSDRLVVRARLVP